MTLIADPARRALASAGGAVLAGATAGVAALRRAAKPLHPHGAVTTGRVVRRGSPVRTGVPWIDQPGEDEVLVRLSRSVGLPAALPDVQGLALRVPVSDAYADLLLASTGTGRLTRFVFTVTRHPFGRPMTTLLPMRSPTGPVVLAAVPAGATRWDLAWARPSEDWHAFGSLAVSAEEGPDPAISFDPVLNPLPGLETYGVVRRLREPAYAVARRTSHRG